MKERTVILLVAAVQFVNILDFMMVMPLGPDFAAALGIPTSHLGYVGGAYTLSAAIAGVLGSRFLNRFGRRAALGAAMFGLVASTAVGGFAVGIWTLLGARVLAGAFGGPATSVALAIIADVVPPARRGQAMGLVMSAFSIASILGVPAGLRAAAWFGWRAPFFGVAAIGLLVTLAVLHFLPPLRDHLAARPVETSRREGSLSFDSLTLTTLLGTALTMLGVFSVVPNISTFLQKNIGYPRGALDILYFVGGIASFGGNVLVGKLVDRFGATRLVAGGTVVFSFVLYFGFIDPVSTDHVIWLFSLLMVSATLRAVPLNTLASRVPPLEQRARFMSAQNAVQHFASALGAGSASVILTADANGRLTGMDHVAMAAIAVSVFVPVVASYIERGVRAREAQSASGGSAPASA